VIGLTIQLLKGKSHPIGTLSLNPAVDMTYEIPTLLKDQKVHATATRFDPGGNGINVGRALKRLNTAAQNHCIIAGEIGQFLKRLLAKQLDDIHYEEVAGETRINGTFIEQIPQAQYEISGIGPDIPSLQHNKLLERFIDHSVKGFGVLTGSLQQNLPLTLYADLARRIAEGGGRAVVDTHGEALHHAIDAQPFLIKPNRYEFEALLGRPLEHIETVATEARALQRRGVEYVCVSLGAEGALLTGPDNTYYATAPAVDIRSSVGAGDSMVAALIAAFAHGATPQEALKLGVACATGTVKQPGTELFFPVDIDNYFNDIPIRSLDI
jgi:6-phosphofructokinase 2